MRRNFTFDLVFFFYALPTKNNFRSQVSLWDFCTPLNQTEYKLLSRVTQVLWFLFSESFFKRIEQLITLKTDQRKEIIETISSIIHTDMKLNFLWFQRKLVILLSKFYIRFSNTLRSTQETFVSKLVNNL